MLKYSKEQLIAAVNSGFDSRTAAKKFNVPASTIRRHRRDPSLKVGAGRPAYLITDEEVYFVSLLKLLPDYGFHVTKEVALELANDYCRSLGLTHQPGEKWLRLFMHRHSNEIKWMKEQKMETVRRESFTETVRSEWFSMLKEIMKKHDLFDKPHQIFNLDETGFSDKTKGEWIIVNANRRHVFESKGGTGKNYFTVLIAINAGGVVLSPFVLYDEQHLMDSWCKGGPPGTLYGVTDNGWMTRQSFEYWLRFCFIPSTAHINRPLLLIMDGYTCHISLEIINMFKENNIICLILPPHTSHGLQPLDVVLFSSVKSDWTKIIKNYLKEGNKSLRKSDFPRLLKKLFIDKQSFNTSRVVSSFTRSGIWPFNNQAMKEKVARNSGDCLNTTTNNEEIIPSNLLISTLSINPPGSNASSTVSNSLFAQQSSNVSHTSIMSSPSSSVITSSNNNSTIVPSHQRISNGLLPSSAQPINDVDISSSPEKHLSIDIHLSSSQQCILDQQEVTNTKKENSSDLSLNKSTSSPPVVAVRNVINRLLSERDLQLATPKPLHRSRGSRLENKYGLNITEDTFVEMKLKQKQEKPIRRRKTHLQKSKRTVSTEGTRTKRRRTSIAVFEHIDSGEENIKDSEIATAVNNLQNVLEYTQMQFDYDISCNIFDSLA